MKLLNVPAELQDMRHRLIDETTELLHILSAIINKQNRSGS
ncbi:MAG TPA: hypothetical protein PKK48_00980 [Phycisphaerae bacterium]|nr:hypothetical protein [Phycisphaerae bacterium]HPS52780.1 hypothetical protein [Phycisphaerae bacterium]